MSSTGAGSNQFVAGPAVSGAKFFGRQSILSTIGGAAASGMSILLVGERRIGKSSILKQVQRLCLDGEFPEPGGQAVIEVSGGLASSESDKTPEFIRQLAQRLRSWIERRRPDLTASVSGLNPHEIDPLAMSECLLELREHGVRILLLFDELDSAVRDGSRQTAAVLRQMLTEGLLVAIATSYEEPDRINPASPAASHWWNVFRVESVGLMEEAEARKLLTVLSHESGREFSKAECSFLIDVFGRTPFYLQTVGSYVFLRTDFVSCKASQRSHRITEASNQSAAQLAYHFQYAIDHLGADAVALLQRVANEKSVRGGRELEILERRGLVVREDDDRARVFSRSFAEFLKELPEASMIDKVKDSKAWDAICAATGKAFQAGLVKAIEIAAQHYL